jgi:hypothetical protein
LAGFALVEALIAIGITGLLLAVLASVSMLSGRTFAAFANYVDLDDANRIAMDTLARDLRECNRVTACTPTRLDIEDPAGFTVRYEYSSATQKLIRTGVGGVQRVMLKGCDTLEFHLGTRNPDGNTFSVIPTTDVNFAKVVNVSWNCSRSILGKKANTENVQTARIVIRRQSPP